MEQRSFCDKIAVNPRRTLILKEVCRTALIAALSLISTIPSRIGTVSCSIFCLRFLCTPFPQAESFSEPLSSTSALANYGQLRRPIPSIRSSSENRCFRSCECSLNVRAKLSLARKSREGCGRTIQLWVSTTASTRRSIHFGAPYGIPPPTLGISRPWHGAAIDRCQPLNTWTQRRKPLWRKTVCGGSSLPPR